MKRFGLFITLLSIVNCMGVQVPEEYVSDLYYGETPRVMSASPSSGMSWTTLTQSIRIQFNNPMAASSLTIDSSGTCTGNLQLYDNNNTGCRAITGITSEKRDSIFVATIAGDLDPNSDYTITVGGSTTDFRGRTLGTDQSFAFKSGIPSGSEPYVVSVTHPATTPAGGYLVTVTFSRTMDASSLVGTYAAGNCEAPLLMANADLISNCNTYMNVPPDTSTNAVSFSTNYKNITQAGPYTFRVSKTVRDKFGINMTADYTTIFP